MTADIPETKIVVSDHPADHDLNLAARLHRDSLVRLKMLGVASGAVDTAAHEFEKELSRTFAEREHRRKEVEAMAKAMYESQPFPRGPWEQHDEATQEDWRRMASASLDALMKNREDLW